VNTSLAWRSWRFWLITLAAGLALMTTLSLGRWQLSRAAEKEALHAALEQERARPELSQREWLQAVRDGQTLLHRSVNLKGVWLPQFNVYLDNRQMKGRPGFFVLTPLALSGERGVVLVQRGWVPRDFVDRTRLSEVPTPQGEVMVRARVATVPAKLLELGAAGAAEGSSRIRQNLDWDAFRQETGLPLLAGSMVQIDPNADGLSRDWFEPATGSEKHYGYAFQWFGLAGLIALLYVWFQIVRRFFRSADPEVRP
jgi:surfeit locus 1 family protein